jgi:cytochrome c-type biogenesis protein CcmH
LPITVILDDSKSMSPQFAMSSTDSVVITARISRAGTPRAAPGDLQGTSTAIATRGAEVVDLLINQRVE